MEIFSSLSQNGDLGLFLLRLGVAIIFIYHSLPKLMKPKMMAQMVGMASAMVFILGLVEFLSALGLVFGTQVALASLLLAIIMIGAIMMKMGKWHVPFAAMDKTGWEFDLILLAASLAILLTGGGTI